MSCQSQPNPSTVEVKATCKGASDEFIKEHDYLFQENIRLKAALKECQSKLK